MEKIKIIFGKQAVNSFLNEGVTALKKNDIDGLCLVREFATKTEKQAYLMGLEDCDGWENYYILDEEEAKKTLFADEIEQLRFVSDRKKTAWGFQLPDGRIIDQTKDGKHFYLAYDRAINIEKAEIYPEGMHPKGSTTLNELKKQGGHEVHCYDEFEINPDTGNRLFETKMRQETYRQKRFLAWQKLFSKNGHNVTIEAIRHQYDAWSAGFKSGYRDEENGCHLFTPSGCNPFSLRLTTLDPKCKEWQTTYEC